MSLLWQLSSEYGKNDSVGILRDIDLGLSIGYDHPKFWPIFYNTRHRLIALLGEVPEEGAKIRNDIFRAKDPIVKNEQLTPENKVNLRWIDIWNFEHQRMILLRQMFLRNPEDTLSKLVASIQESLKKYPIPKEIIPQISKIIAEESDLSDSVLKLWNSPSHVVKIAFFEWCIASWKFLKEIVQIATMNISMLESSKQDSMEYWDYVNLRSLAEARKRISQIDLPEWSKSFSLSGGAGNSFAQLAIMQKYVEDGWKIQSISWTSAWSAIAVLVAGIGNDAQKLKELMDDFQVWNQTWEIPEKLGGNEDKMKKFFYKIAKKYKITNTTKFSDLSIPVLVNAGRQYIGGEQEIVLGGNENVMDAIWASQNVPALMKPWKNTNEWEMWITKVHEVPMIDYAANERWNATHWLKLMWVKSKDMVVIDVGYSSERWGSPSVRRLFSRADTRDIFAKMPIQAEWGIVIDVPLTSGEWYSLPKGKLAYFFSVGLDMYKEHFTSRSSPQTSLQ